MRPLVSLAALAAALSAAVPAHARETKLIPRPPDRPMNTAAIGPGTVIFFNRQGGTYTHVSFGNDDARTNKTSLPGGTLSPFACGDAAWQQVMTCLKQTWAPFNVTVTDVDPGSSPHVECVVAGSPSQVGEPSNVGGIAPASCLDFDNPVSYAFANVSYMACDPAQICWTASQETAHTFGLDHEVICKDPMTYDDSCGANKSFQNQTAQCGEYQGQTHSCFCGGTTQNSVQALLAIFGPSTGTDAPPMVSITQPANNATVMASFPIAATASDDHSVTRVELWIDGAMVTSKTSAPFSFTAPAGLAAGAHTIMARAVDSANQTKDASISVNLAQNPPSGCTSNSQCQTGYECSGGQCVMIPQPGQPDAGMPPTGDGQLGTPCADNSQCLSGICGTGPDGMRCTQICTPGGSDCPVGFDCLQAGNQGACWPSGNSNPTDPGNGTNSGGCSAGGAASAAPLGVVAMLGLALLACRRPGRARAKSR